MLDLALALQLLVAQEVVLRVGLDRRLRAVTQDLGRMKTIRLVLSSRAARWNSSPIIGIEPRIGTRLSLSVRRVLDQAAEHDDAAVVDQHAAS